MELDEKKVLKVLNTLGELSRLSVENNRVVNEIRETLSTGVFRPETVYEIYGNVRVKISKYPEGTLINNDIELVDCGECELEFDGRAIYVYNKPPNSTYKNQVLYIVLSNVSLKNLLMLYYLEVGNEGCLDALVNEVVKKNEKLASWLETLKKVLALVKIALT